MTQVQIPRSSQALGGAMSRAPEPRKTGRAAEIPILELGSQLRAQHPEGRRKERGRPKSEKQLSRKNEDK